MHFERRVLVSGGAGFLGSHLCERLLELGCQVLCVDNFFTGARHNIDHLLDHKRFELLRHDITHPLFVEVDEIFNLACPASPIHYQKDPVQTTKTLPGLAAAVRVVEVVAPDNVTGTQAAVSYLDERFEVIAQPRVLAFAKESVETERDLRFRRGDADADGKRNVTDAVVVLLYLFRGGAAPPCLKSADFDDNGKLEIADAISQLSFLFLEGRAPAAPFETCGVDMTVDELTCKEFPLCQ